MPLDTSTTYPLTKLRLDGRRWNELRLLQAQISTNPASSGSSYLCMGNTAIICSVHGPAEGRRGDGGAGGSAGSSGAVVEVDVNIAGFAGVDRKRRAAGSDRYVLYPGGCCCCCCCLRGWLCVLDATANEHTILVVGNHHASPRPYARPFSRTCTRTSTRTAPSASTCRCSRPTGRSWRRPSTPAHSRWLTPGSPCPGCCVGARQA